MAKLLPPAPRVDEVVAGLLARGVEVSVRVRGVSMKPFLPSGSVLRFSARRAPAIGDVALTRHADGALVIHRVVGLGTDWLQTKGDACSRADARLPRACFLGCAVSLELPLTLPLHNRFARSLGRLTNRAYPTLARLVKRLRRPHTPAMPRARRAPEAPLPTAASLGDARDV